MWKHNSIYYAYDPETKKVYYLDTCQKAYQQHWVYGDSVWVHVHNQLDEEMTMEVTYNIYSISTK